MHVQAGNAQPVGIGAAEAILQVGVPNAVLRLFTAGVGFLAVAVAETGIDAQRNVMARGALAQLIDHVGRAAIGMNAMLHDHFQRSLRRKCRQCKPPAAEHCGSSPVGSKSGGQGTMNFAGTNGIDEHALAAD